jgi:hypothetical protein
VAEPTPRVVAPQRRGQRDVAPQGRGVMGPSRHAVLHQ